MRKKSQHLLFPGLLIASILSLSAAISPVHAPVSTFGLLCVADATSTTCPSSPFPTFNGQLGTQLKVAVNIQLGCCQGYNAFDIRLAIDNTTILNPTSVDLTGSTLPSSSLTAECINGQGTGCMSTIDVQGVVRVAINATGTGVIAGNGHLFSITYNITGVSTGASMVFETLLVTLTPPSNLCNGPCPSRDLLNPQGATFLPSTFSVSPSPASLTISKPSSATSTLNLKSVNGFAGSIMLTVALSPSVKHDPTLALSAAIVTLSPGGTTTSSLTVSTIGSTPAGSYTITLTAMSGALSITQQIPVFINK